MCNNTNEAFHDLILSCFPMFCLLYTQKHTRYIYNTLHCQTSFCIKVTLISSLFLSCFYGVWVCVIHKIFTSFSDVVVLAEDKWYHFVCRTPAFPYRRSCVFCPIYACTWKSSLHTFVSTKLCTTPVYVKQEVNRKKTSWKEKTYKKKMKGKLFKLISWNAGNFVW